MSLSDWESKHTVLEAARRFLERMISGGNNLWIKDLPVDIELSRV
jgi:hypothetical protein